MPPFRKNTLSSLCLAWLISQHAIADTVMEFDIPAQNLADALKQLANQGHLQMLYDGPTVQGKSSAALKGQYSPEQAVQKLLIGSGLQYRFTGENTVAVKSAADTLNQADPATLPAVKVVGRAEYDVKDPYNQDYVLPNATAGTKTDTPIMETPLNVQVISKQVLKDQQAIRLDQALKNVSGVTFRESGAGGLGGTDQFITLRGFESPTYFRNGFRISEGSGQRDMANIESVEVLKGSAAILYGLVEPGGMVNVVTKQPLATPYYSLQQQFGSFDLYRTTMDATGPLTKDDTLLYRMNMSYENSGSFRDLVQNEKVFVAPVVKWNISPKTQVGMELEYSHNNLGFDGQFVPTFNGQFIKIPRNLNYGEATTNKNDVILGNLNWSHQFNDDWSIKHRVLVNHNVMDRLGANPYSPQLDPASFDQQVPRIFLQYKHTNEMYATNIDLTGHFSTGFLKHTLLLGGDYYRNNSHLDRYLQSLAPWPGAISAVSIFNPIHTGIGGLALDPASPYEYTQNIDQYGAYLQDQIKLPYNFHFTGGFRYQYIHTKFDCCQSGVSGTAQSQDAATPRVGLLWQAQNWLSLYSNYTENFGANTGIVYPGKAIPPTSAQQWEIGAKTEFFGGRLRATLAYYDLTKQNIVAPDPTPGHSGFSLAVGEVHSRGPELDIQGEILPGWNAIATYANIDIIVTKAGSNAYTGATYPDVGGRYYGVPRNTASLWNTYDFQVETLKGFKIGGGVTLRDGQLAENFSGPDFKIPGYATVDLLAAYSRNVGKTKVTAQLNINNLLDKYYYSSAAFSGGPVASGYDGGWVGFGAPRSVMGSIKVEF